MLIIVQVTPPIKNYLVQDVIGLRLRKPASTPPAAAAKSIQSYLTLCNPTDGSQPGSPIRGILQARTLEWVAISFSNA